MALIAAAVLILPHTGIGAPFPNATVIVAPEQTTTTGGITKNKECFIRYRLNTADPIGTVAKFYQGEAARGGAVLLAESGGKLANIERLHIESQSSCL